MRGNFDFQLEYLNNNLVEMGALVEKAIGNAIDALVHQNVKQARENLLFDRSVNDKEREIEHQCLKLLLLQHPVASDLRLISSVLKMITDLERIGDQAQDISELVIRLSACTYIKRLDHLKQMAEKTSEMVTKSIDAFVSKNMLLAQKVIDSDDEIDNLFNQVKEELIALIHQNVDNGEQAIDLLMIAKYFERIGDHAVNVAEWVIFSITGKHKGFD